MSTIRIHDKNFESLFSSTQIQIRVAQIGAQINTDYYGKCPLFIGVLNGAFLFMADLIKNISIECELSFVKVSSYSGTKSTGTVKEMIGLSHDLTGRDVIIVEDIVDTGDTAVYIMNELKSKNPATIRFATILYKPLALKQDFKPDYVGFEIPPDFVVGYGLDYDGLGRNLNDIYRLKA